MFTPAKKFSATFLVFLTGLMLVVGCAKKCQQPATEVFRTFIDQEWRLVETNNPQFGDLSNVTFITMTWKINFTGEVFKVENNDKFNTPALQFIYNVDVDQKLMKLQYKEPPSQGENGESSGGGNVGNVVTYRYALGRDLKLTESGTNYTYRYVPFTGVVRPDEKCTF